MAERITLDPSEVAGSRTSLDITPWVSTAGPDWGDASMTAYMAEQSVGSAPVDYRIPNRQINIPLVIRDLGGTAFATIRASIQSKVGIWQAQGGWLKRVLPSTGGTVFCDVVSAQLHLGGDWLQANRDADVNAAITLEAIPDFYEAEETLADHAETTAAEITFTETTANGGDFPLGDRVRIVVDNDQASDQRGLFWAWRGRNYSSATTAASAYEAEALTILDTATRTAKVGASGGSVVSHASLATSWTPVVGTNLTAGTYLTHTGTNRIYARVFSASGTLVQSRFVWDVGDLVLPSENDAIRLYNGGTFHILDLGEVRLDPSPTGTHRWQGQIQAKGDVGAETFSVDRVWIVNQDESGGVLRAPVGSANTSSAPVCRDEFNQTSGNLDAPKAAAVGGNWGESTRTGANGFQTSGSTAFNLTRTTVSDADLNSGSYAFLGSAVAACVIQADVKFSAVASSAVKYGLLARYTDASNWLIATINPFTDVTQPASPGVAVFKRVAGTVTLLGSTASSSYFSIPSFVYNLRLTADAAGNWAIYWGPTLLLSGSDSVLATGGTLASGKVGLYDAQTSATACTRTYDNFISWAPTADAVAFASQSVELGTQGIIREDSTGTAYGPVSQITGDMPRMPNRSSAGTVEFVGKLSRGDFISLPDTNIDDISAQVYRRASHLLIPS